MRIGLTALLLVLTLATPGAAQEDPLVEESLRCDSWYQSRSQPGTEVVACDQAQMDAYGDAGLTRAPRGGAAITGPGDAVDGPPAVYHDDDPTRLARVRVIGRGTATGVFVTRFDREGLLMDGTFEPFVLPDGVPLVVTLTPDGATLSRVDTAEVLATATVRVARLDAPTRSPLSVAALEPVAAACLAYRRGLYFDGLSPRREIVRQLRDWRAKRARLATRLRAATRTAGDRRLLHPLARSLRAGNRPLRALSRWVRRGRRVHGAPAMRAFNREYARERRLRRRLRLDECSA